MSENLKNFLEFIASNPELLEKAKQLKMDDSEKVKEITITFAKENGFELTEADFEAPEGELSESELSGLAGGGSCFCAAGGGGTEGGNDGVCACVGYGQGDIVDNPTGESLKGYGGRSRCVCILMGSGEVAEDAVTYNGGSLIV